MVRKYFEIVQGIFLTRQGQLWNASGRCATCGGSLPGTPEHQDIRCPRCVEAGVTKSRS